MRTTKYLSNKKVASKEFGYNDASSKGIGFIHFYIMTREITHEDGSTEVETTYIKNDARDYAFYSRSAEYDTEKGFRSAIKRIGAK